MPIFSRLTMAATVALLLLGLSLGHAINTSHGKQHLPSLQAPKVPEKSFLDNADEVGLTSIEHGGYPKEEDERFLAALAKAHNVKILVCNGSKLFDIFRYQFEDWLEKQSSSMQLLLCSEDSDFYREETLMSNLDLEAKGKEQSYRTNKGLVGLTRDSLVNEKTREHITVKYFDTQFRLPMIIMDNQLCFLSIRLSPNQSAQSVRLEFQGGPHDSFDNACVAHFDRMWKFSSDAPYRRGWLLSSTMEWSRGDLLALLTAFNGFVPVVLALLTALGISLRLRRNEHLRAADRAEKSGPLDKAAGQTSSESEDSTKDSDRFKRLDP